MLGGPVNLGPAVGPSPWENSEVKGQAVLVPPSNQSQSGVFWFGGLTQPCSRSIPLFIIRPWAHFLWFSKDHMEFLSPEETSSQKHLFLSAVPALLLGCR